MENTVRQTAQDISVSHHYDKSEKWNKELYVDNNHFFNRLLVRRKEYSFKLFDRIAMPVSFRAIDLGCGPGAYLEEFTKRNYEVYGVDISQEMLNTCAVRLKVDDESFRKKFICGSIENVPFDDNYFDAAACIGVLGLLISDIKTISEIRRILMPGGVLLLTVENMLSLSNLDFILRHKIKSLFNKNGGSKKEISEEEKAYPGITISSNWFPNQLGMNYKIYNPYKLIQLMNDQGFELAGAVTAGHEFRILRRLNIIPNIIDRIELKLEKYFRLNKIPYFSYSGQFFVGAFIKK